MSTFDQIGEQYWTVTGKAPGYKRIGSSPETTTLSTDRVDAEADDQGTEIGCVACAALGVLPGYEGIGATKDCGGIVVTGFLVACPVRSCATLPSRR
jgi:hypothetical protein